MGIVNVCVHNFFEKNKKMSDKEKSIQIFKFFGKEDWLGKLDWEVPVTWIIDLW